MFNDKSRLLLLGALGLLVITLIGTSSGFGGFHVLHYGGWTKIALIAFLVWFLMDRCGGGCGGRRRDHDGHSEGDAARDDAARDDAAPDDTESHDSASHESKASDEEGKK